MVPLCDIFVEFWGNSILVLSSHSALENAHHAPIWVKYLPLVVGLAGIGLAYLMYMFAPELPGALSNGFQRTHRFLINKWYFDEFYDAVFVKPIKKLGSFFWKSGDQKTIDRYGLDGISQLIKTISYKASKFQTGYLFDYAFVMLIGLSLLLTFLIIK